MSSMKIYPEWKIYLWRLIRGAVATALGQTLILQVDWTDPDKATKTLLIAFVSGFIMALGVAIRDQADQDQTKLVHKLPI